MWLVVSSSLASLFPLLLSFLPFLFRPVLVHAKTSPAVVPRLLPSARRRRSPCPLSPRRPPGVTEVRNQNPQGCQDPHEPVLDQRRTTKPRRTAGPPTAPSTSVLSAGTARRPLSYNLASPPACLPPGLHFAARLEFLCAGQLWSILACSVNRFLQSTATNGRDDDDDNAPELRKIEFKIRSPALVP